LSTTASEATFTALPPIWADRDPADPVPSVPDRCPLHELDAIGVDRQFSGDDVGEHSSMPLSVGEGPDGDPHPPVGTDFDRRVLAVEPGDGRQLDVAADADPEEPAATAGSSGRLLAPELGVADQFGGRIQCCFVVARVVGGAGGRRVGELGGGDEVPAAEVDRVEPQPRGEDVETALEHRGRLGATSAAEGAHRCGVRGHAAAPVVDGIEAVGPVDHRLGVAHDGDAEAGKGPQIGHGIDVDAHEPPVRPGPERDVEPMAACLHGGEVLRAALHPAHGSPQPAGDGHHDGVLGLARHLATEPAPDGGADNVQVGSPHPDKARGEVAEQVGVLGRCVHRDAVGAVLWHGQHRVRLQWCRAHAGMDHTQGDGDELVAGCAGRARHPVHNDVRVELGEEQWGVVTQCRLGIDDARQWLFVDDDCLRPVDRSRRRVGDHGGDDLSGEAHCAVRERGPVDGIREHRREGGEADGSEVEVGRGEDPHDARHPLRLARVDALEPGVGTARADELDMNGVRHVDVGREPVGPCQQIAVFETHGRGRPPGT
jgi:hypothetical protein